MPGRKGDKETASTGISLDTGDASTPVTLAHLRDLKKSLLDEFRSAFSSVQAEVKAIQDDVNTLKIDVMRSKIFQVEHEQRSRAFSVRFYDVDLPSSSSSAATSRLLYERFIKPSLTLASASGVIDKVPDMTATIEYAHRLSMPRVDSPTGSPPPKAAIICRFTTRLLKAAFMMHKKAVLAKYNTEHKVNIRAAHDLCKPLIQCIHRFRDDRKVHAIFSLGSSVKIILSNDKERALKVFNPFALTIAEAIKPV